MRPSGVRLQASTLSVKVYLAEDLPQSEGRERKGEKERERERERGRGEGGNVIIIIYVVDPQHFKSVFIKGSVSL